MFVFYPFLTESAPSYPRQYQRDILTLLKAQQLYDRVNRQGQLNRLWGLITRRSHRLLELTTSAAADNIRTRHYLGRRTILIEQICGTENRSADFDVLFYPRRDHNRKRWVSIAAAKIMGQELPPVELIRVGDYYFVRDGHHRISVARALGEQYIEAEVTVWQTGGSLAGERSVSAALSQPAAISPLLTARNLDR
jgi:hypothetical protein